MCINIIIQILSFSILCFLISDWNIVLLYLCSDGDQFAYYFCYMHYDAVEGCE